MVRFVNVGRPDSYLACASSACTSSRSKLHVRLGASKFSARLLKQFKLRSLAALGARVLVELSELLASCRSVLATWFGCPHLMTRISFPCWRSTSTSDTHANLHHAHEPLLPPGAANVFVEGFQRIVVTGMSTIGRHCRLCRC